MRLCVYHQTIIDITQGHVLRWLAALRSVGRCSECHSRAFSLLLGSEL